MLLRTAEDWLQWINDLDFAYTSKVAYAASFAKEEIKESDLPHIDHTILKACKVDDFNHRRVIIVKAAGEHGDKSKSDQPEGPIRRPFIMMKATDKEMDRFTADWTVYKEHNKITDPQVIETQMLLCCARDVRTTIKGARSDDQTQVYDETTLLGIIRHTCVPRATIIPHVIKFRRARQMGCEDSKEFYTRLLRIAADCKFKSPDERVREQFMLKLKHKVIRKRIEVIYEQDPDIAVSKLLKNALDMEARALLFPLEFKSYDIPLSDGDDDSDLDYDPDEDVFDDTPTSIDSVFGRPIMVL